MIPDQSLTKENLAAQLNLKKSRGITKDEIIFRDAESGKEFVLSDGRKIASISQFIAVLTNLPDEFIFYHITSEKNDFAAWIKHVFGVSDLSSKLKLARNKEDMLVILKEYFK